MIQQINKLDKKIAIVGAGLSGLLAAEQLLNAGADVKVYEATARVGGRTYSVGRPEAPVDLGATWFGPEHKALGELITRLELPTVNQRVEGKTWYQVVSRKPPVLQRGGAFAEGVRRFAFGGESICKALLEHLPEDIIQLNQPVKSIRSINKDNEAAQVKITTDNGDEIYDFVLIAVPPQVARKHIKFSPALPADMIKKIEEANTWMGHTAKFMIAYEKPFWRDQDFSGSALLRHPIVTELHDTSPEHLDHGMLIGFLDGNTVAEMDAEERKSTVINIIRELFGPEGETPMDYHDFNWYTNPWSAADHIDTAPPHYANDRSMILTQPILNGTAMLCSSECSSQFAGYMEGAIHAANMAVDWVDAEVNFV